MKREYDPLKEQMGTRDRLTDMRLAALELPKGKEPPLSQEEKDRRYQIGRNHVIGRFKEHNEFYHDVNCKIRIKAHARYMLPRNSFVKQEALKVYDFDDEPDFMNPPGPRLKPGLWEYAFPEKEVEEEID